jgi:hypothetical protein
MESNLTLDDVFPVIRRAFAPAASSEDKEQAATYLRLALAALETPAGQPLTPPPTTAASPPAPTAAPVAPQPSGIPDVLAQLIDHVMARLPPELRADVERRAASDVPMLPFFPPTARH